MARLPVALSLLLESVAAMMCAAGDFYGVLGVESDASGKDISAAFRKLALRYHPDKNMDKKEEAERRMREISEAYTVLSNSDERRIYDASRPAFQASQSETPSYWYQAFPRTQQASGGYWEQSFSQSNHATGDSWYQSSSQTKQASGGYWHQSFSQTQQASGGYWEQSFSRTEHGYKQTWIWRQPQQEPQCASSDFYHFRFA